MTIRLDGGSVHGTAGEQARNLRTYLVMRKPLPWRVDTCLASKVRTFPASNCEESGGAGKGGGGSIRSQESSRSCPSASLCHSTIFRAFVLPSSVKSADFNQGTDPSRHVPYSAVAKDSKMPASPQLPPSNRSARSQPGALPPDQATKATIDSGISPGAGFSEIFGQDGSPFQRASLPTRGQSS